MTKGKTCTICKVEKELTAFSLKRGTFTGRKSECKECFNAKYNAGREKISERKQRVCIQCGIEKESTEFREGTGKRKFGNKCQECLEGNRLVFLESAKVYNKKWREDNWDSYRTKFLVNDHKKKGVLITEELYNNLHSQQNGLCAICNRPNQKGIRLCMDHCHTTGKVRGFLCNKCNRAIGLLEDDVKLTMNATTYLRKTNSYKPTNDIPSEALMYLV